jgi:hypothetical protein
MIAANRNTMFDSFDREPSALPANNSILNDVYQLKLKLATRLLDNSLFGQLALGQLAIWTTRYLVNSLLLA